jgi:hypothetical protein
VAQGDEVYPEAILGGVGTGTITGQWLWDGNVTEQFVASFTGGQSATVQAMTALPTVFLGLHTLELRITSPNTLVSNAIKVIVNPGSWKQMHLIAPDSGSGYAPENPPLLRWSIVAGAVGYQVGFATQPFFGKVSHWYDVADTQWQVTEKIWTRLPSGELYWTVRAIELGKQTSHPAAMRRLWRVPNGALMAVPKQPTPPAAGVTLLQWLRLSAHAVYRVTLFGDPDGKQVVRRALTTESLITFRDTRGSLQSGKTYYWQVEAFSPTGRLIFVGRRQSFIAGPSTPPTESKAVRGKSTTLLRPTRDSNDFIYKKASLTDTIRLRDGSPEDTTLLRNRVPAPKQVVHETRPLISIEFRNHTARSSLSILLDNTEITAMAQATERKVTFRPLIALENGTHVIEVNAGSQTESWEFVVDRQKVANPAADTISTTDAEIESGDSVNPSSTSITPTGSPLAETDGRQANYELSSHSQWVSGNAVDNNVSSLAAQASIKSGPWRAEVAGTGLINFLFSTKPKHALGQFNDYVMRLAHDQKRWGADLRFGTIAPQIYIGAEFMNTAYPRQGAESALRTPAGTFSIYGNAFDRGGQGTGDVFAFRQQVNGAAYQAPLPSERVAFRFTWLRARDTGTIPFNSDATANSTDFGDIAAPKSGNSFDALFTLRLGKTWRLTSEYAFSSNNLNTELPELRHFFGRAWRTGISGIVGKTMINLSYRSVSPDFANPVTASLGQLSTADRRGVDASFVSPTRAGVFNISYQFLQSDVHSRERRPTTLNNLNWNWSRNITSTTIVTFGGNVTHTGTGDQPPASQNQPEPIQTFEIDQSRLALNSSLRQTFRRLTLTVGGSRNWFIDANNRGLNNVSSALNVAGQWHLGSFFQLQANYSVNWLEGDKFIFGKTRSMASYIQPVLSWRRLGLAVSPLVTINQFKTTLGPGLRVNDMLNAQYGGRLSWQMPGRMRFSTLSFEGSQSFSANRIQTTSITTPRLLVVWTLLRTSKQAE